MSRMRKMGNKGFTLVEIMLSIAILALISIPLMKYFSDSLRYAAQTAEKQKATLLAQETVESIKAQKKLVKTVSPTTVPGTSPGPDTYVLVPELVTRFGGYAGAPSPDVHIPSNFTSDGATGTKLAPDKLIYRYVDEQSGKYYVETSLCCTTSAASVSSPAILGIDDTRNVVIAENNEEQEALAFFKAKNIDYYLADHGGFVIDPDVTATPDDGLIYITPEPDPSSSPSAESQLLELEDLRANMKRIIFVTITKGALDEYYNVRANYVYYCTDVYGNGSAIGNLKYPSPDLCEANVQTLEGVYIMFNKLNGLGDDVQIEWNVSSGYDYPDFRFVAQDSEAIDDDDDDDDDDAEGEGGEGEGGEGEGGEGEGGEGEGGEGEVITPPDETYQLKVYFHNFDDAENHFEVHSNLTEIKFFDLLDGPLTEPDDVTANPQNRGNIDIKPLTGDGIPVRIFDIEVKVYKNKAAYDADSDHPIISIKTSKVE